MKKMATREGLFKEMPMEASIIKISNKFSMMACSFYPMLSGSLM